MVVHRSFHFLKIFRNAANLYLKALERNKEATVTLGDAAYHRSNIKEQLGLRSSVQLRKDGVQLVVCVSVLSCSVLTLSSPG